MDSQILVTASVLTEDIYKLLFHKKAGSNALLKISRISVILVSALGLTIAFDYNKTIMDTVTYSWAGLGCALGPLLLMSFYYPKMTRSGAIAGILVGGIVAGFWHRFDVSVLGQEVPAMIPGFFGAVGAIVLGSKNKK